MFCGSGSRLAKAAGAEPSGRVREEKLHAIVARSTLEVKITKRPRVRTAFGSWDVEKVQATVAGSTFEKRRKHKALGAPLEVETSTKSMRLWQEAHVEAKMYKTPHARSTFGGMKHWSTFGSEHGKSTTALERFWNLRGWKIARYCGAEHMSMIKARFWAGAVFRGSRPGDSFADVIFGFYGPNFCDRMLMPWMLTTCWKRSLCVKCLISPPPRAHQKNAIRSLVQIGWMT